MVSHSVVALKLRMAKEKREEKLRLIRKKNKPKTSGYIRPKLKPIYKSKLYIHTDYVFKEVKKEFRRRMNHPKEWSKHPLLNQVVPYKNGQEAEYKLVRWVERGINPYSGKDIGPAANRSVFDYLTDHQLNLAIRISNEYKLKPK